MAVIQRMSLSEQVRESIVDYIKKQGMKPGEKLPTEKEFSELFGVSRTSVREAIKALALNGTLKSVQGKGTFLLPYAGLLMDNDDSIIDTAKTEALHKISDIREVRIPLELTAIELATLKATPENIEVLREISESYMEDVKNGRSASDNGRSFHDYIAQMTGNALLMELQSHVADSLDRFRGFFSQTKDEQLVVAESHFIICDAIKRKDVETAKNEMIKHLELSFSSLARLMEDEENISQYVSR